jgi:hypothetical protein
VYSAKTADSINTISKVKTIHPTFIIDEAVAKTKTVNGKECYVIIDSPNVEQPPGVTYYGPMQNCVPVSEYETTIDIVKINDFTYVNALIFEELPINYLGTVIYYSVIGVDEDISMITHLSKVTGVLMKCEYKDGMRHLYSCDNYTGTDADVWNKIGAASWYENLVVGNINDKASIAKYGLPFVETVPAIEQATGNTRMVLNQNFMVLEIQNPWQKNNHKYNFRKLKSFKLQNVFNEQYGEFSEPTFQSELPLSIEKMVILRKTDTETPETPIDLSEYSNENVLVREIIRRDGIYYNSDIHKKYGINKYNIPLEEEIGVFTEGSVQDLIKIQMEALPNHVYSYTIYLIDVYGHVSEAKHFIVHT